MHSDCHSMQTLHHRAKTLVGTRLGIRKTMWKGCRVFKTATWTSHCPWNLHTSRMWSGIIPLAVLLDVSLTLSVIISQTTGHLPHLTLHPSRLLALGISDLYYAMCCNFNLNGPHTCHAWHAWYWTESVCCSPLHLLDASRHWHTRVCIDEI